MVPNASAPEPKVARNSGRTAVVSSWPMSENRLSIAIAKTFRVSHRVPIGFSTARHEVVFHRQSDGSMDHRLAG
jgi:hypothetical protein